MVPSHQSDVANASALRNCRLRCIACGQSSGGFAVNFRCPACGDLLEVVYTALDSNAASPDPGARPDLKSMWLERKKSPLAADQSGVWRFRDLLPVFSEPSAVVTLREGNTPLYSLLRCPCSAGVEHIFAKHQGMNPSGSFKDTGMTVAISLAKHAGFEWVACASTGNTSASMAAYAARAGMGAVAMIPEGKIAWSKLAQTLDYGAHTFQLKTDFDGCVRVLAEVVRRFPLFVVNSVNPFRLEGQKTAAFEIMEQLDWSAPDHVIVPGGNLANSSAIGKGFLELVALGLIPAAPRVSIIQAAGANPLVRSMREFGGTRLDPMQAETRASAIRIGNPAIWKKAVKMLGDTNGCCEDVTDEEIALAKAEIGSEGIGCEPASATTLAGLKKLVRSGFVRPGDTAVLILTGHVLKDPEYALDFHRNHLEASPAAEAAALRKPPVVLEPNADAVIDALMRARA
jgi:threonine synthase